MLAQARTNVAAASNAASNAAASNANADVANANANATTQFEFVQAPAEDLSFLKDASVDLLVAGTRLPSLPPSLSLRAEPNPRNVTHALTHPLDAAQAAHWFDWSKMWPEAARVLRKGGSVAFWVRPPPPPPSFPPPP